MKITDVAAFVGKFGHRYSQIYTMDDDTSSYVVDYYDNDKYIKSLFYKSLEEAETKAQSFAFQGEIDGERIV